MYSYSYIKIQTRMYTYIYPVHRVCIYLYLYVFSSCCLRQMNNVIVFGKMHTIPFCLVLAACRASRNIHTACTYSYLYGICIMHCSAHVLHMQPTLANMKRFHICIYLSIMYVSAYSFMCPHTCRQFEENNARRSRVSASAPVCLLYAFKVCCSVLQCVAMCCSVLQCVAVCCSVLQCVAVCCSVLQCAAVCCSVLQRNAPRCSISAIGPRFLLYAFKMCCIMLQYVAV